jgi:5-methylcytosine-specific restriction protein A
MTNPGWTRDELILLLDLYVRIDGQAIAPTNSQVIELSSLLNSLHIHSLSVRDSDFRNPVGIAMKLRNLQRLDPCSATAGLPHGSRLEADVWNEFSCDAARLRDAARAICDHYSELQHPSPRVPKRGEERC